MTFDGFPYILGWELTLACNLRCEHCGSSAGTVRDKELTTEEALAICKQLPQLLVQEVDFTGGEPMVRKDWPIIASQLIRVGTPVNIISNGLAIDRDNALLAKKTGISHIGISLDGLEQSHDKMRGHKGLFQKIIGALEILNSVDIPTTVLTTVTERNVHELLALRELLISLGVTQWRLQPLFQFGRVKDFPDLALSEKTYLAVGTFMKEIVSKKDSMHVLAADSCGYFSDLDFRDPTWHGCNAGIVTCGITSDGKIKGCLSLPDNMVEGDLRKEDLWSIWFNPNAFKYTRSFAVSDLGCNCSGCEMALQCKGGCSAMSLSSTGVLHNDPYCYLRLLGSSGN
jgi:radical SAM protein with 4Fe4S-binding SPASM domain